MVVMSLNSLEIEKLLFQPTKNALLLINEKGNIQFSNSRVEHMFLFKRSSIYNRSISSLFSIKQFSVINAYIYRSFNSDKFNINKVYKNLYAKRKDDDIFKIEVSFKLIKYQQQKLLLLKITDLSEDTAFKEKQRMQEHQKRLDFVSNTSHELRAPLTTILSSAEILDKFKGSFGYEDIQTKNINRIKTAVQHLTGVLNDFLKLNKIEDYSEVFVKTLNIKSFCEEVINTIYHAKHKKIYIKYTHKGNEMIQIDEEMLVSILNNLLNNAVKYANNNTVVYFDTCVCSRFLSVTCKDSGIGIPKKEQNKIFNRYYRASNANAIQGTGLGLSIVKEYLDKIGGQITVKSQENIGTVFNIKIPLN